MWRESSFGSETTRKLVSVLLPRTSKGRVLKKKAAPRPGNRVLKKDSMKQSARTDDEERKISNDLDCKTSFESSDSNEEELKRLVMIKNSSTVLQLLIL